MRILVVEDQTDIAEFIQRGLEEARYYVTVAANGNDGLQLALERQFSIIILDIMLPGRDGWSICTELRDRRNTTPIIMLTARDSVRDRVQGLELGADDYLPKPFDFSELLARVQAAIRRDRVHKGRKIRVADLEIDTRTSSVYRAGVRIEMTQREFTLLEALASQEGRVLTRDAIMDTVWRDDSSYSNTIDVHVKNLRKKVDSDHAVKLIHSVYGQGYIIEPRAGSKSSEEEM
jgi:two-component system copper resistance phosphate regulon response regulator CusR